MTHHPGEFKPANFNNEPRNELSLQQAIPGRELLGCVVRGRQSQGLRGDPAL